MKRCPKCSRTFPDDNQRFCTIDGGLLVAADKPFDPNATIQGPANLATPTAPPAGQPASNRPRELDETIAGSAPTAVLPRQTGPTGLPTAGNLPPRPASGAPPPPQVPPPPRSAPLPQAQPAPAPPVASAPPSKKSKLPLILGILALLVLLGVGGVVAAFFIVIKPRLDQMKSEPPVVVRETQPENVNTNTNANTSTETKTEPEKTESEFVAPPDTTRFTNSNANLNGKLAEHYFDFSFYYPNNWEPDPKAGTAGASNFAKVERRLPPDFTQENFAVGWYTSKGTFADDEATFPQLVEVLGKSLASNFPGYRKVSEGPTKVNSLDGYEFRFVSISKGTDKGDIQVWGRVVFLPTGVAGEQNGATLVMLATSLAPELTGVEDVGEKGEMPVILESFRFAKSR
ncbi:MAG: hypothetical protein ACREA9_00735 [Pyrinomonadaceae bacterium]